MKTSKKPKLLEAPICLNIGCGTGRVNERGEPLEGYTHLDISPKVKADVVHDVTKYPWPFKDESVSEIFCSHFLEHLDGIERMAFFNECYRIMKPEATMKIITPAPFTHRYMQDPSHKFPMIVQEFYNYLNQKSREAMGVSHYPLFCNFEWAGFFMENPEAVAGRNDEYKHHAAKHWINSLLDLVVTLTKK